MNDPFPPLPDVPRHHRPVRRRAWVVTGVGTCAVIAALGVTGVVRSAASAGDDEPCGGASRPLRVVAAPEIAAVVADVVRATAPGARTHACPPPVVTAADPADTADAIANERGDRP